MSHPPQEQMLRARGWSIQSDGTNEMTRTEKISSLQQSNAEPESPPQQPSSETNGNNKRPLLDEETSNQQNQKRARLESDVSYPSIATSDDSSLLFPPADDNSTKTTKPDNNPMLQAVAQSRLSKWAARLFDPNRPRGLIQPPQTIPLNDEFLQAFGRREKELDKAMGVTLEIEHEIEDEEDDNHELPDRKLDAATTPTKTSTKVKITNLKYTTTAATLEAACMKFGSLELVNLIMDTEKDNGLNKGLAYVTFTDRDAAQACIDELAELDGRNLTVTWAANAVSSTSNRRSARYWIKDLSTKCYRCGLVGHVEANCDNEPMAKPCPLCAMTDHDLRNCPNKAVCFNCGVPGHVSRDCRRPRGLPPRRVCTVCLQSDHNHCQCRRGPPMRLFGMDQVICMSCHQPGHHLCRDMKWFFGLDGVSCFNCGMQGHTGNQCDRPNLEACHRNEQLGIQEIARAGTFTAADRQTDHRRAAKTNNRGRGGGDSKQRAQSMPPQKRGPRQQPSKNSGPRQPSKSPGRRRQR